MRAYVYHQENRDTDEYMEEIIGEAATEALANRADDDDDRDDGISPEVGRGGVNPRVHVFKGHARWSRSQLMNEIARGDWGLCLATPRDLTSAWRQTGDAFWRSLYDSGRPVFSKVEDE